MKLLVIVMMSGFVSQGLIFGITPPLLPAVARAFGGGPRGAFIAELFGTIPALGLIFSGIIGASLLRWLGTQKLILASLGLYGIAGTLAIWATHPYALLVECTFLGFASGCLTLACTMLVSSNFGHTLRVRVIGYQLGFSSLAVLVGIAASGIIAQYHDWRVALSVFAIFSGVMLLVTMLSFRGHQQNDTPVYEIMDFSGGPWRLYVIMMLFFVATTAASIKLPFIMEQNGILRPGVQASAIAALTVCSTSTSFLLARIQKFLGAGRVLIVALISAGIGMLIIGISKSAIGAGIGSGAVGIGMGLILPHIWAEAMQRTTTAQRSAAMGLLNASVYVGTLTSPVILYPLEAQLGLAALFIIVGILLVCGAITHIVITRYRERHGAPLAATDLT